MARTQPRSDNRAVARLNALTHGLTSRAPVIPDIESAAEFEAHRAALVESWAPVGALESELVERVAELFWRLRRPARYEREYIAASIERVPDDFLMHTLNRALPRSVVEADENVDIVRRCIRLLERLPATAIPEPVAEEEADLILELATSGDDENPFDAPLRGFEKGVNAIGDDWSTTLLKLALTGLAARYEIEFGKLLALTIEEGRRFAAVRAEERQAMLAEMDRMRRERLLPDASTLHALTRYEASLHRMLTQSMHELEAAQARRNGHDAPPCPRRPPARRRRPPVTPQPPPSPTQPIPPAPASPLSNQILRPHPPLHVVERGWPKARGEVPKTKNYKTNPHPRFKMHDITHRRLPRSVGVRSNRKQV